ncbi:hypothetical protein HDV00_003004 [Rhizophlyctis rosea]|nr:hypothetical protein HDV00_003004 [Rhizophlyctis rosea]
MSVEPSVAGSDDKWAKVLLDPTEPFNISPASTTEQPNLSQFPEDLACPGIALRFLQEVCSQPIQDRHVLVIDHILKIWSGRVSEGGVARDGHIHLCDTTTHALTAFVLESCKLETHLLLPCLAKYTTMTPELDKLVVIALESGRIPHPPPPKDGPVRPGDILQKQSDVHYFLNSVFHRFESQDDFQTCERPRRAYERLRYMDIAFLAKDRLVNILEGLLRAADTSERDKKLILVCALSMNFTDLVRLSKEVGVRIDPLLYVGEAARKDSQLYRSSGMWHVMLRYQGYKVIDYLADDPDARTMMRSFPTLLGYDRSAGDEVGRHIRYIAEEVFVDDRGEFDVALYGSQAKELFEQCCMDDMPKHAKYLIDVCHVDTLMTLEEMRDMIMEKRAVGGMRELWEYLRMDPNKELKRVLTEWGWETREEEMIDAFVEAGADLKQVVETIDIDKELICRPESLLTFLKVFERYKITITPAQASSLLSRTIGPINEETWSGLGIKEDHMTLMRVLVDTYGARQTNPFFGWEIHKYGRIQISDYHYRELMRIERRAGVVFDLESLQAEMHYREEIEDWEMIRECVMENGCFTTWKQTCKNGTAKFVYDAICPDPEVFGRAIGLDGPPSFKAKKIPIKEFDELMGGISKSVRLVAIVAHPYMDSVVCW